MIDKIFITTGAGFRYMLNDFTLDLAVPDLYSGDEQVWSPKTVGRTALAYAAYFCFADCGLFF